MTTNTLVNVKNVGYAMTGQGKKVRISLYFRSADRAIDWNFRVPFELAHSLAVDILSHWSHRATETRLTADDILNKSDEISKQIREFLS